MFSRHDWKMFFLNQKHSDDPVMIISVRCIRIIWWAYDHRSEKVFLRTHTDLPGTHVPLP